MTRYRYLLLFIFLLLLSLTITFAAPAEAAAPRMAIFYGGLLAKPIYLTNWTEYGYFDISDESPVTPEELEKRPYIQIALFWGREWVQYMDLGKPVNALRPEDANQHGRFYPAYADTPAVFAFDEVPGAGPSRHSVNLSFINLLTRHGIHVRIEPTLPITGVPLLSNYQILVILMGMLLVCIGTLAFLRWPRGILHNSK